jgi:hypothetical protein
MTIEWLKRLHHKPNMVDKEFYIVDIKGFSLPLWIISMEGHTAWSGMIQKENRSEHETPIGSDYLGENGQFRRSYRWAISARRNICETWGLTDLHEPLEAIDVEWDGFPLDSTFSRGRMTDSKANEKSAYDIRKYFEFKYANGLPILGVQVSEEEALRRAKSHVGLYHYKLAKLNCDFLIDYQTELEIAGIQLIHMPFWSVTYVFRPKSALRHFFNPKEKHMVLDGYGKGVLSGQLAMVNKDKVTINAVVCGGACIFFLLLGSSWHPAFYLVSIFAAVVAAVSAWIGLNKHYQAQEDFLQKKQSAFDKLPPAAEEPTRNSQTG